MQISPRLAFITIVLAAAVSFTEAKDESETSLWATQKMLAAKRFVDLTHEFEPGIPHWPGFPDEMRKKVYWYNKRPDTMGAGFFAELFTHVGQWGTHVDPPAHFVKGLRTVDQIDPKEPESGAIVVVSFPKPKGGCGFPARVFAILP
jgi:kynurenine formamidase